MLAATGVDVMLPEFVNFIDDCVAAVDACAEAGRPVWLGVPMVTTDGITRNGETMEALARALRGHPVQAVLLMCSRPEAVSATLPRLRQAFDGPIGAYPNVGYNPMAPVGGRVHLGPDLTWAQADHADPARRVRPGVDRLGRPDRRRLLRHGARAHHGHEGDRRPRPRGQSRARRLRPAAMRIVESLPRPGAGDREPLDSRRDHAASGWRRGSGCRRAPSARRSRRS